MDHEQLTTYIKDALARGLTEDTIRSQLAQSGWPSPIINTAFERIYPQQGAHLEVPKAKRWSRRLRYAVMAGAGLLLLGAVVLFILQLRESSETPQQSHASYQPPSMPSGWKTSTIQYDSKTFTYSYPGDWVIDDANAYTAPGGGYTDRRLTSSDFKDADSIENGYIILKGAAVNIQIAKYSGDLDKYEDEIKNNTAAPVLALGYSDLKQTAVNGRPVLSYTRQTNYVKTVALVDQGYLVTFEYFQPYKLSQANDTPAFEDSYLSQFNGMIASFSLIKSHAL